MTLAASAYWAASRSVRVSPPPADDDRDVRLQRPRVAERLGHVRTRPSYAGLPGPHISGSSSSASSSSA